MADNILTEYTDAIATVNDELRTLFMPDNSTLLLLKPNDTTDTFDTITTVSGAWLAEYQEYRNQMRIEVSNITSEFKAFAIQATHLKVNDDVYMISQGDTITPQGFDPFWVFFGELFTQPGFGSRVY